MRRITSLSSCAFYATAHAHALLTEFDDAGSVRRRKCPHDDVDVRQHREHVDPYDFAKPAFHAIAIDGGVRVPRHDDARPGVTQKGSDIPNVKVRGSDSLPLQADRLERAFPRQPVGARKAAIGQMPAYFDGSLTVRRLRPFFRRRLSVSLPHFVSIRARNPCVAMRRLFRGR